MKLFRYGKPGSVNPAVEFNGKIYEVSHLLNDYDEDFFADGGLEHLTKEFNTQNAQEIDEVERYGPPVYKPGKIICIGFNYGDHTAEADMQKPTEPVIFFKATSSIVGPNDDVIIPKDSKKTDWGVELAVVIGTKANYVSEARAMDYVAGYTLHNNISERSFQFEREGQWVKGKSCDTFAPLGPYIVTKDEIKNPHDLRLWLTVNGEIMQDDSTKNLIFNIPQLVSYLSQFMSLMPGDIISTGTPKGVGMDFDPPRFLKPGDVMESGIEGVGNSRQEVKVYK